MCHYKCLLCIINNKFHRWSASGSFCPMMVLGRLYFLLLINVSSSSKQGFGMRVNGSIPATCSFHLSLPVTLSSKLSKDYQTDLVNHCQGKDFMIFTIQLENKPSLLSIYPARQQLPIICSFLSLLIPLCCFEWNREQISAIWQFFEVL